MVVLYLKTSLLVEFLMFKNYVLAATYSRLSTTIGAEGLNCRVRNENGCTPFAKPPTHNFQTNDQYSLTLKSDTDTRILAFCHATPKIPFESSVGELVHLGSRHYCPFTWCLSTWSSPTGLNDS